MELVDRVSRIEENLSSLEKHVSSMERKFIVVVDYVIEKKK